jgi:hypothetical protein
MWDMNEFKRCSGYRGHWECEDQSPNHILHISMFGPNARRSDNLQTLCRDCMRHRDTIRGLEKRLVKLVGVSPGLRSEFGQSKPMTKRTITKVEGERVPEGWVYVVRNPDVPHILKVGKTFPDGIGDIMSSARRFGRAELVAKYEFKEAYKAEQSIHKRLAKHNLRALGYTDCGKELFQCDEMVAVFAILSEGPVLDETEDAA